MDTHLDFAVLKQLDLNYLQNGASLRTAHSILSVAETSFTQVRLEVESACFNLNLITVACVFTSKK